MTCIDWETTTSNNTNQYSPNNSIYSLVPIRSAWNPHSMSDHSPSSSSSSIPPEQTFNGSLVLLIKQPKTTHHPEMVMDDVALPHKLIPSLLEFLDQSMHRQRINKWSRFPIHSAFTLCRWSLIRIWIQMSNSFARWDPLFLFHGSLSLCLCVRVETRDKCVRHHQLHEQANRCPTDYIHLSPCVEILIPCPSIHSLSNASSASVGHAGISIDGDLVFKGCGWFERKGSCGGWQRMKMVN